METEKILYSINQVKEKLDSYGILYYDLPGTDSTIQLGGKGECDTEMRIMIILFIHFVVMISP